jgi:hypothetical protein
MEAEGKAVCCCGGAATKRGIKDMMDGSCAVVQARGEEERSEEEKATPELRASVKRTRPTAEH